MNPIQFILPRREIWLLFCFLFSMQSMQAQIDSAKIQIDSTEKLEQEKFKFISVDFSKLIYPNLLPTGSGYTIELTYRTGRFGNFGAWAGVVYGQFRQREVYRNTNFACEGGGLKFGLDYGAAIRQLFPIPLYIIASGGISYHFQRNEGEFFIPGNYFETYRQSVNHRYQYPAFIIQGQLVIPIHKKWHLGFQSQLGALTGGKRRPSVDQIHYFVPGIGTVGQSRFASSYSMQLLYRIL